MILLKKAVVSMWRHKKAYISCIILMGLGVALYTVMNTGLLVIEEGKNEYYAENRLGDAFALVSQIPRSALSELEEIEGVKQVDGRLIQDVRVVVPDNKEDIITVRLVSTIIGANDNRLNAYVYEGQVMKDINDIYIGHDMYIGLDYEPGDKVTLLINGKMQEFNVVGSIFSPEYVYIVKNQEEIFSDTTKFNIAYIDEEMFMKLTGNEGVYNDLSFMFEEGYDYNMLKDELEYILEKYNLIALYEKADLFSYMMMEEEIKGGRSMATSMPMTFVLMAAVVLYLMMKRIIEQDRGQIGILKAFGYSDSTILWHYISFGLVTGILGAVVGTLFSFFLTSPYIEFYLIYYKLPISSAISNYYYFYIGGIFAVFGGVLGSYLGAKGVLKLKPADAMRSIAPKPIKKDITEYLPSLKHILTARGLMATRNILRNKVRSVFIVIGIVFSFAMMTMMGMMDDLMDAMFYNQFTHVLKYEAEMVLDKQVPYFEGVQDALSLEDIELAEGILKLPVLLHNGHLGKGTILVGIKEGNQLYKIYDDQRKINLPLKDSGIVLSSMIANALEVDVGDHIYMESPYFEKDIPIRVTEVVDQSIGTSAFIDLSLLSDLLGQEERINSIIFNYNDISNIREALVYSNSVTKIEDKDETLSMYREMLGTYDYMMLIMEVVAMVIGFTIIYNTAVISMSERSREYATLRVIGMNIKEVKEIMSFEYWILCFVGIIVGIPFANFLNYALVKMMEDIDAFSWPSTVPFIAYVIGAIGCIISVFLSNMTSVKAIKHLSLVEVLKERE